MSIIEGIIDTTVVIHLYRGDQSAVAWLKSAPPLGVTPITESVSEMGRASVTANWRSFFCVVGVNVDGREKKMGSKAGQRRKK